MYIALTHPTYLLCHKKSKGWGTDTFRTCYDFVFIILSRELQTSRNWKIQSSVELTHHTVHIYCRIPTSGGETYEKKDQLGCRPTLPPHQFTF